MIGKITIASLNGLEGWIWDQKVCGLGARKQRRGIFFYLRYRHGGRQQMHSIGRFGSPWTVETARAKALELLGILACGTDPFASSLSAETFGAEVERYLLRKKGSMKPRSFIEDQRYLLKCALPLHKLSLSDIDRRTVAVLLGQVETSSGPIARNRLRSSLSAFFAWAIAEGLNEQNPVTGTTRADEGRGRERVLSPDELTALLDDAIESGALSEAPADDISLADLIVRGRRRSDGAAVFLVVEVSWGVGPQDVERAIRRAALLAYTGTPALPVVAGTWVTPEAADLAHTHQVWQLTNGQAIGPE